MTRLDPLTSTTGPAAATEVWREQLLDALLRIVFLLGIVVAVPSVAYASYVGEWIIAVVDAVALLAAGLLAFRPSIGFWRRAVGFLAINFVLGIFLFLVVGPVAGMYLMGVPVLAAVLLGQRPAVLALILNGITMVVLGFVPLNPLVDDGSTADLTSWLVVTTNFMFVNAIITLSSAAILARLERSLRLNRRLAVAVEQSPNGIIISEPDGTVVYANRAAEGYFGFDASFPGLQLTRALSVCEPPLPAHLPPEGWNGMISTIVDASTQRRTFSMTVQHSHDDDDQPQVITIAREVTEELALQEQLARSEKLQALGALVGGTAHDFNNALGAIMGLSQILRSDLSEPDQIEIVDDILLASDRAQAVVRQLMMFGQHQRITQATCNLSEMLHRDLPIYRANLPANLVLTLEADLDVVATIDANDLHHVVANLVTNAAHAMRELPEGSISIALREIPASHSPFSHDEREQVGAAVAHLSIRDTGHGIEPSVLAKVFDPFFTTKPPDEGTGLGLAIVHGTITASGGRVTIDSTAGVGTTANLYLPTAPSTAGSDVPDNRLPPIAGGKAVND